MIIPLGAAALFICLGAAGGAAGEDGPFDLLRRTVDETPVHRGAYRYATLEARVHTDTVLRLRLAGRSKSCASGWFEREGGGYICGMHLEPTAEAGPRLSPLDDVSTSAGLTAIAVTDGRPRLYARLKDVERGKPYTPLRKGSVLVVRGKISVAGAEYYETRQGSYVAATGTEVLAPPLGAIGIAVPAGGSAPLGVAIDTDTPVFAAAEERGEPIRRLARYAPIPGAEGRVLVVEDGWVALPDGGFVRDASLARVREAPRPRKIAPDERWIAVDLAEQLVLAHEGERLVRVVPCSTGVKGNTPRGRFRIEIKRRLQTMTLRFGQIRVEDVPWVMYYEPDDGLAIHSAYWHYGFGRPMSHGCVNLTPADAHWLFEWSVPRSLPEDSERYPVPRDSGTRVIVF